MARKGLEKMTISALRQKLLELGDNPPAKMRKADLIQRLEVCGVDLPFTNTSHLAGFEATHDSGQTSHVRMNLHHLS